MLQAVVPLAYLPARETNRLHVILTKHVNARNHIHEIMMLSRVSPHKEIDQNSWRYTFLPDELTHCLLFF